LHFTKEEEMGGACSTEGRLRNPYKILLVKPVGRTSFEGPDIDKSII
jgi:hypothetical protein